MNRKEKTISTTDKSVNLSLQKRIGVYEKRLTKHRSWEQDIAPLIGIGMTCAVLSSEAASLGFSKYQTEKIETRGFLLIAVASN